MKELIYSIIVLIRFYSDQINLKKTFTYRKKPEKNGYLFSLKFN